MIKFSRICYFLYIYIYKDNVILLYNAMFVCLVPSLLYVAKLVRINVMLITLLLLMSFFEVFAMIYYILLL